MDNPCKKLREFAQVGSVPNPELPVFDGKFPPNSLPLNSLDEPNKAVEAVIPRSIHLHVIRRDLPVLVRIGTSGKFSGVEFEPIRSFWNDAPANHIDAVVRFLCQIRVSLLSDMSKMHDRLPVLGGISELVSQQLLQICNPKWTRQISLIPRDFAPFVQELVHEGFRNRFGPLAVADSRNIQLENGGVRPKHDGDSVEVLLLVGRDIASLPDKILSIANLSIIEAIPWYCSMVAPECHLVAAVVLLPVTEDREIIVLHPCELGGVGLLMLVQLDGHQLDVLPHELHDGLLAAIFIPIGSAFSDVAFMFPQSHFVLPESSLQHVFMVFHLRHLPRDPVVLVADHIHSDLVIDLRVHLCHLLLLDPGELLLDFRDVVVAIVGAVVVSDIFITSVILISPAGTLGLAAPVGL